MAKTKSEKIKKALLLINRDKKTLRLVKSIFGKAFTILQADNEETALDCIMEYLPDIVLIDVGEESFTSLALDLCLGIVSIPTVAMMETESDDMQDFWISNGAVLFLKKPLKKKTAGLYQSVLDVVEGNNAKADTAEIITEVTENIAETVTAEDEAETDESSNDSCETENTLTEEAISLEANEMEEAFAENAEPEAVSEENAADIEDISADKTEEITDVYEKTEELSEESASEEPAVIYPLIRLRGITKTYKTGAIETKALRGIDLDIEEGEFIVILGESGSGKTTLLNIIGGIDSVTEGEYLFRGESMVTADEKKLNTFRKDTVSFIFQSYNLLEDLTAKENLRLVTALTEGSIDPETALASVGLARKVDFYPSQLSGGEQQRVSIARALAKRPKLILADEPTAALDSDNGIEVLDILHNITKKEGCTTILITHNPEIARMADRVLRIKGGKIAEVTENKEPVGAFDLRW